MIYEPRMLLIGSTGRNSGKTSLACRIIANMPGRASLAAAKVTAVDEANGQCPRGGAGCGVCSSLDGRYCLAEETEPGTAKDTQRLLASGVSHVYWLRVLKAHLAEGAQKMLDTVNAHSTGGYVICESNSLRNAVEPGLFLMCRHSGDEKVKASAASVRQFADRVVTFDGSNFDVDIGKLHLVGGHWALPYDAAAIVLAGGKSTRMGEDKASLRVGAKPLAVHVRDALAPHFEKVLLSVCRDSAARHAGAVPDIETNRGPLMGILSVMEAELALRSAHEWYFVAACDMPEIDLRLMRRMFRARRDDCDAVAPATPSGPQPLFALYRRGVIPALRRDLAEGRLSASMFMTRIRTRYVDWNADLLNINIPADYTAFINKRQGLHGLHG